MRHLALAFVLAMTGFMSVAASAAAQDRIALVIGNNRYANLGADKQLAKAVNDARAVGDALEKIGFKVIRGENLTRQAMVDRVFDFTRQIKPGDTAFLFYAGHGVALSGGNYLLPSDVLPAGPGEEARVRNMALGEADLIADIQERKAKVTVLVLDACRDNPFRQPGLTRTAGTDAGLSRPREAEGVFTVYSAGFGQSALDSLGPGDTSPNSVFTRVLVPALGRTDAHLGDIIYDMRDDVKKLAETVRHNQSPAFYDQTSGGRVYLASRSVAVEPSRAPPAQLPKAAVTPQAQPLPPPAVVTPPAPPRQQMTAVSPTDRLANLTRSDAASYPSRPIELVVPFAAGGGTDVIARSMQQHLSTTLKQPVVVQNKPGAAGAVAAEAVARSAPDGHTLMIGTTATHAMNPSLIKNLSYNPERDFEPVSLVASTPMVLLVSNNTPVKDLASFAAYLKANPGKLNYGSSGIGTFSHAACESLAQTLGGTMTHVPYRGSAPAFADLTAGMINVMCETPPVAKTSVESGKIKALAVTSAQRSFDLPNAPTFAELGYPAFKASSWIAVFAPKGTPDPITAKLNAAVYQALSDPGIRTQIARMGGETLTPDQTTQAALRDLVRSETARWKPFLQGLN